MDLRQTRLYQNAAAAGLEPHAFPRSQAGLLVTVVGGRVLGVFLGDAEDNLLWVHPELSTPERAKRHVASGAWNFGGDRVWLSPELELHFKNPERPTHLDYVVPADVDPGRYCVRQHAANGILLQGGGVVQNLQRKASFTFELVRSITLCAPPTDVAGLQYIGYELGSELRITQPDDAAAAYSMWQLMQIPPGGAVTVALRRSPEVVDYFQTNVADYIQLQDTHVTFPVTGRAQHKLGLRTGDARGLLAYLREVGGGEATLIVRQVVLFPGATYADYPTQDRSRRDIPLQFYNDAGEIGGFGEMEYHSVAATRDNFFCTRDVSRTWCFRGPAARLRALGAELLDMPALA